VATETIAFSSTAGLRLEGRLAVPDGRAPSGGVVLCHPHSKYGGSMSSSMIPALQRAFVAAGWAALRFNFRGVGRSEGTFDGGTGEVADVHGALARVREEIEEPVAVAGWSFGALVALNAVAAERRVESFTGIAPPAQRAFAGRFALPTIASLDAWCARTLLVGGTADDFCLPEDLRRLGAQLPPPVEVRVVEGADHFFTDRMDELSEMVVGFVTGGRR
jgi:alpha/beta superfamily hydrolase